MKKIVFLTPGLGVGGAERQLALLANGLKEKNHRPIIISLSPEAETLREYKTLETHICPIQRGTGLLPSFLKLRRKLRHINPDIIQGWMYAGNIFSSLCAINLNNSSVFHSVRASNMDGKRYGLQTLVNGWLSYIADGVSVNSIAGVKFHQRKGFNKDKLIFIPNGIDTEKFNTNPQLRKKIRQQLGFTPDEKIVLYVARLDPMKAHDTVLAVAKQSPDIRFVLVGKETQTLKAPTNVSCLGVWEDMTELYNAADLLINISRFGEGFPNVIGEAMACNLRVLTNDVGDSINIIGDTGFICNSMEAGTIAQQLKAVVSAEESGHELPSPREKILSSFSVDAMIRAHTTLYKV